MDRLKAAIWCPYLYLLAGIPILILLLAVAMWISEILYFLIFGLLLLGTPLVALWSTVYCLLHWRSGTPRRLICVGLLGDALLLGGWVSLFFFFQ